MKNTSDYQPIVIIGAPRSGTNMLRDVLCSLPGAGTWPCDEINYLWRHGNALHPHDELGIAQARPRVRSYIRQAFQRLAQRQGLRWVVEKTCANSLRVDFVNQILPEAKFIFLVRDGRDAAASAMKRWTAPLDFRYVLNKARFVPASDLPRYGAQYASRRVARFFSREKRLVSWGPRWEGMEDLLKSAMLAEICAAQWARCVTRAQEALARIDGKRQLMVRYEDFVARPADETKRLLQFLEFDTATRQIDQAVHGVTSAQVGNGRHLTVMSNPRIADILNGPLAAFGYDPIVTEQALLERTRIAA